MLTAAVIAIYMVQFCKAQFCKTHMNALVKADEDSNIEIEEEINYDDIDKRKQEEKGQQL